MTMNTIEKIAVMVFAIVVSTFAAWTGIKTEPASTRDIDGTLFYVLSTPEELAWFAEQVNNGKNSINAVLNDDIVFGKDIVSVSSRLWIPIGVDSSKMFNGVFDGYGHSIYGMVGQQTTVTGMFGYIGEQGIVKNFSLICDTSKSCFSSRNYDSDSSFVGGVVGFNYGLISNVKNYANIYGFNTAISAKKYQYAFSGGIAGANYGRISNCKNEGIIESFSTATIYQPFSYSGGIAAYNKGVIENCENMAKVTASTSATPKDGSIIGIIYVGGIVAYNAGSIFRSSNYGFVYGFVEKNVYLGGICGFNDGSIRVSENRGRLYAYANLSKGYFIGGIAGAMQKETSLIQNCKNSGNITLKSNAEDDRISCATLAGGIAASNGGVAKVIRTSIAVMDSISNYTQECAYGISRYGASNSYVDTVNLRMSVLDAKYYHSSQMKTDSFAYHLNAIESGLNSGVWSRYDSYPIFADSNYLAIRKVSFRNDSLRYNVYTNYKGLAKFPENPKSSSDSMIFVGWYTEEMQRVDSSTVFYDDMTVYARFEKVENVWYSIRFYNADSTLFDSLYLQKWSLPTNLKTPSLEPTERNEFKFKKWNELLDAAQENKDYYAVYDTLVRLYTIVFIDDTTTLKTMSMEYGSIPAYSEAPSIDSVKEDMKYSAVYDSLTRYYAVRFMNGQSVLQKDSVAYGDSAKYRGETPGKAASKTYEYRFAGWSPKLGPVTQQTDYVAVFDSSKLTGFMANQISANDFALHVSGLQIEIFNAKIGLSFALFDLQGHVIAKGTVNQKSFVINAENRGHYIVKIGMDSKAIVVK